jgi:hypothetical protein
MLERLEPGAGGYFVIRPRGVDLFVDWVKKWNGPAAPFMQMILGQSGTELFRLFGFDPFVQGWAPSGLDPDAPVVGTFGTVDPKLVDPFFAAAQAKDAGRMAALPRPVIRYRVIARLADERRFRTNLTRVRSVVRLDDTKDPRLDPLTRQLGPDLRALRKLGVVAVDLSNTPVFVRIAGGHAVLDVFDPLFQNPVPFTWARDGKEILAVLGRTVPPGGAASLLTQGAGRQLVDADLGAVIAPERFTHVGRASALDESIRYSYGGEAAQCDPAALVAAWPFEDGAFSVRVRPDSLTFQGAWTVRAGSKLLALPLADDGLIDGNAASDAVVLGVSYLTSLAPVRALPRVDQNAVSACGWSARTGAIYLAWPASLFAELETVVQRDAPGLSLDSIRNAAVALRTVGKSKEKFDGVLVMSAGPAATKALDAILATWATRVGALALNSRHIELYLPRSKADQWFSFVRSKLDGGNVALGAAIGGRAAARWLWGALTPRMTPTAPSKIATLRVDLPRAAAQLLGPQVLNDAYAKEVEQRLGNLTGALEQQGDTVLATLRIDLK